MRVIARTGMNLPIQGAPFSSNRPANFSGPTLALFPVDLLVPASSYLLPFYVSCLFITRVFHIFTFSACCIMYSILCNSLCSLEEKSRKYIALYSVFRVLEYIYRMYCALHVTACIFCKLISEINVQLYVTFSFLRFNIFIKNDRKTEFGRTSSFIKKLQRFRCLKIVIE